MSSTYIVINQGRKKGTRNRRPLIEGKIKANFSQPINYTITFLENMANLDLIAISKVGFNIFNQCFNFPKNIHCSHKAWIRTWLSPSTITGQYHA